MKPAPQAGVVRRRVKELTRRCVGRGLEQVAGALRKYLLGWRVYFGIADAPGTFRTLDGWIRHRLRAIQLKQWRRGTTVFRELRKFGVPVRMAATTASCTKRWWRSADSQAMKMAFPVASFDRAGVPRLATV